MANKGKRYIITVNQRLAMKLGYIGEDLIRPNFLKAVIKILLGGGPTPPLHIYYAGSPDARLRKKFGLPEPKDKVENAYE